MPTSYELNLFSAVFLLFTFVAIPDEAQYEIFTDPITGKQYIRTEDGEILEIVVGEDGKTYLKTKSGKLRG